MVVAVGTPDLPDSGTTRGDPQDENKSGILRESPSFPIRDKGFVKQFIEKEIGKQVIRRKLAKQRHLIVLQGIQPEYLTDHLFPIIKELFDPQQVTYNGGIAKVPRWKISCYLEVLPGGIPCTRPNTELLHHCLPLLESCNYLFSYWYRQQHACNRANQSSLSKIRVERLMTFVTRYTPKPGEQALLKVSTSSPVYASLHSRYKRNCCIALSMRSRTCLSVSKVRNSEFKHRALTLSVFYTAH